MKINPVLPNFIAITWVTTSVVLAQQPEVIIQRESIRRQEIVIRSTQQLNQAAALIAEGRTAEAEEMIRNILASVPDSGDGEPVHQKASQILSNIEIQKAQA
ncbi:MAG: hypothetical protein AAF649_12470, partial [Verrucomicrobiota bacterium]